MSGPKKQTSVFMQFLINVFLPLLVLTKFSGEEQLGATGGLILALAFPIVYEAYNIYKRRRVSMLSVFAIGGILITGIIGLLGLSENWLALRRSIIYAVGAAGILGSMAINKPVMVLLVKQVVDFNKVKMAVKARGNTRKLNKSLRLSGYAASAGLLATAAASFVLTKAIIVSPAGTTGFNEEYARLRVISTFAVTLPLIVGLVIIISLMIFKLEKLSGLGSEEMLHKKPA
jgi:MFS family permease